MEFTEARQAMVDNLLKQPQDFEKRLEVLFTNPHFGDVVTEVFPAILDPHNSEGRAVMKKYAEVAQFLDTSKDVEEAIFVALRVETENIEHDSRNPRQGIKAFSLRYYEGLRAEHFSVARDDAGNAIGVRVEHPSYTAARGWKDEPKIYNTEPTAIIDSTIDAVRWRGQPISEQECSVQYVFGENTQQIDSKIRSIDERYRFIGTPLWGVVLEIEGEAIYRKTGRAPEKFPPIETPA